MATTTIELASVAQIRDRILEDQRRMLVAAGVARPNIAKGSERYTRAEALAAAVFEITAREVALQDAQMPDTATGDDLTRLCSFREIYPSPGAGASGYVLASCTGTVAYPVGSECTTPDGLRYTVATTTIATDGVQVPVIGTDTGKRTNKDPGTILTWTSPPAGSATTCEVDVDGLRFGADADTDATLRRKLLDDIRHPAKGGNWAHIAKDAEGASAAIEKAFVYPAIYGPATMQVAITVAADAATYYTRQATTSLQLAASHGVVNGHPEHADLTLTTVTDYDVDLVLDITVPEPKLAGGVGGGWIDATGTRWPTTLLGATPWASHMNAAPTNPRQITVHSNDTPVAGAYFAIWSSSRKKFIRSRIYAVTVVGGGVFTLDLYTPVDVTAIAADDYITADAEHLDDYAATVAASFSGLGPGQKTSTATYLPRAYRRPLVEESWSKDFTSSHLGQLSIAYPEVSNVLLSHAIHGATDTTALPFVCPAETVVGNPPNCLRLGKLAFY